MTERIQNAIDIFLDAINKGTLAKGSCVACAVGNLVAAGMNAKIYIDDDGSIECNKDNHSWSYLFLTSDGKQIKRALKNKNTLNSSHIKAYSLLEQTKFSMDELAQIEFVFETHTIHPYHIYYRLSKEEIRKDQINGLRAVIELMMTFDNVKDNVDEVFTKKAKAIPLKCSV